MKENNRAKILKELGQLLTLQYDYPPNGEGSIGYKGFNMYRFKVADKDAIAACLKKRAAHYEHSYNAQVLAQEIITDLLDEGLITYGGYDFKKQQKDHKSI